MVSSKGLKIREKTTIPLYRKKQTEKTGFCPVQKRKKLYESGNDLGIIVDDLSDTVLHIDNMWHESLETPC